MYIRKFWKKEFTKPRNFIYISEILHNNYDIATPLTNGKMTWYNGMYISKRAFKLNNIIPYKYRFIYEYYFSNNNTKIKGIVAEKCNDPWNYLNLFNDKQLINKKGNSSENKVFKLVKPMKIKYKMLYLIMILILIMILKEFLKFYNKRYI